MEFRGWAALHVVLRLATVLIFEAAVMCSGYAAQSDAAPLRVAAAAVELEANDEMVIAGGITAGKAQGQEVPLRVVAVVLEQEPFGKLAIVSCDVLMATAELLAPALLGIERETGIGKDRVLISCTHTHHAPSTVRVHGYGPEEIFCQTLREGTVKAVKLANSNLGSGECNLFFAQGEESTVGQNSRLRLEDGEIYWVGPRTNVVRATGPIDPELPVLAFRNQNGQIQAVIFNHSVHNIGTREPGRRSPGFYGLAAQDLEAEFGCKVCFLSGAFGSTHNLELPGAAATQRITDAIKSVLNRTSPRPVRRLAAVKRTFEYQVRYFDDAREDAAVARYCRKYVPSAANQIIEVFRTMRHSLARCQGETRSSWLQVMLIGDIALVGVPAELFTQLGLDIKNRSPFRHTYVVGLANDWIGYMPDATGHKLGGYQVWTGYHSYVAPGTGERLVDQAVSMLGELVADISGAGPGERSF